jgi:hypothetical protein
MDGNSAAHCFCKAAMRVTAGSNAAILSFPRKKSVASLDVLVCGLEPNADGRYEEGEIEGESLRMIVKHYHTCDPLGASQELQCR